METEDCDIIIPWDRHFASQEEAVAAFRSKGWHEPSKGVLYNERFWTIGAALRWIAERSQAPLIGPLPQTRVSTRLWVSFRRPWKPARSLLAAVSKANSCRGTSPPQPGEFTPSLSGTTTTASGPAWLMTGRTMTAYFGRASAGTRSCAAGPRIRRLGQRRRAPHEGKAPAGLGLDD
jgi:hypothetical protein